MQEILNHLPSGALVLDLGCASGSFPRSATAATVVRFDRDPHGRAQGESRVQGDASLLPFADRVFDAIISNHSLEHFDRLDAALSEIGRVIKPGGALFVSVPDSSTLTDRLYRWLGRGGGHVNAFTSAPALAARIEGATGLKHVASRTLYSSLCFLNRHNALKPRPRRLLLLGGGFEMSLTVYVWLSRRLDALFHLRTGIYGWALYFGNVPEPPATEACPNVCIRCGSGTPASLLKPESPRRILWFSTYRCPSCGTLNPFVGT
ncbi:MAG TPA: class I SAM-dependent methyltransferase [Bryobacteraceae bacterium]|nr:class I SAM-dependent methyltransferase [Bryobacteraceae bacterium]